MTQFFNFIIGIESHVANLVNFILFGGIGAHVKVIVFFIKSPKITPFIFYMIIFLDACIFRYHPFSLEY